MPLLPIRARGEGANGSARACSGRGGCGLKSCVAELAALQEKLLAGSEWVGDAFPEKARAMHLGEIEQRQVHGRATVEQVRSLGDEGVPVMPLPLPIVPPGQVN